MTVYRTEWSVFSPSFFFHLRCSILYSLLPFMEDLTVLEVLRFIFLLLELILNYQTYFQNLFSVSHGERLILARVHERLGPVAARDVRHAV